MREREDAPVPGLRWGVKASFTSYVARMPNGRVMVGDGATVVGREILWAFGSCDSDPRLDTTVLDFRGFARFRGHGGMLYVRLAAPRVSVRTDRAALTMPDFNDSTGRQRVTVATFSLAPAQRVGNCRVWHAPDVRLHEQARAWFGDAYPAGAPMDPITMCMPEL